MDNVQHERLSATNKRSRNYEEEDPVVARVADAVVPELFRGHGPTRRSSQGSFQKPRCVYSSGIKMCSTLHRFCRAGLGGAQTSRVGLVYP